MPRMMRSVGTGLLLVGAPCSEPLSVGRKLLFVFRWGVFLLACAFLHAQLTTVKGTAALEAFRRMRENGLFPIVLLVTVLLMVVNWSIESRKWRWLMLPVERIGAGRSLLATVAGTSVGLITPNRTGEFLGRVLFLEPHHRVQGGFATALGSVAQFVITLVMGGLGLLALYGLGRPFPWTSGWVTTAILSLTVLVSTGALALYLHPGLLRQLLLLIPFLHRAERASAVLNAYEPERLYGVLALSALRYVVFTGQFVLLLTTFDPGLSVVDAACAVPVIYLVSTLIPTVMITELGIRGTAAVSLLVPLGGEEVPVLFATAILWSINVVLPAMVGSVILLMARIRTNNA